MIKIIIGTITFTRLYLYLTWDSTFMYAQKIDRWHHIYTGVILVALSLLLPKKYLRFGMGIGLGLFLDEFIHLFHILDITTETDYWSAKAITTTIIGFLLTVFIQYIVKRKKITL